MNKLLLLDDDPLHLGPLRQSLEALGYQIVAMPNGLITTPQGVKLSPPQWNAILKSAGDGFITFSGEGKIHFMNPIAEAMTGWRLADAVGKPLAEVVKITQEDGETLLEYADLLFRRAKTGPLTEFNLCIVHRDGSRIPVRSSLSPIRNQQGEMHGGVIAFRNISELRDALEQARKQASRAESLLEIIAKINTQLDLQSMLSALLQETLQVFEADGAVVFLIDDERGRAQIVSTASVEGWLKPLQGSRYELEADDFTQLLEAPWLIVGTEGEHTRLPEIFEVTPRQTAAYVKLQQEQRLIGMLAVFHKNRLRVYLPDELAFLKGLANQASVAITNAQLFENVRASRTRLQHLSKRLVEVQDSERRLMARELHDEIGQVLTGLQFILESGRRLAEGEAKKGFENAQAVVGGLIKQVRDLSMKLLPSMLEDMGLLPTLLWHFDQYLEQTGIEVSFEHFGIENRYPPAVELTVYRIIQEALTNTARYANIKRAQVRVVADDESIHLLVQDNGKGFDLEKTTPTHAFGLMGMRERAFLMGGQLTVESAPGEGTTIKATLPITGRLERRKYDRKGLNRR